MTSIFEVSPRCQELQKKLIDFVNVRILTSFSLLILTMAPIHLFGELTNAVKHGLVSDIYPYNILG